MKRTRLHFLGITLFLCAMAVGCATGKIYYRSVPEVQKCSNEYYEASIRPDFLGSEGWEAFKFTIISKTAKTLELDWNRTFFISNGKTKGTFMFKGVVHKDRNKPKPPDVIFPGVTLSKYIWPNKLVYFSSYPKRGWYHRGMGAGEFGILLSVKVRGTEVKEKMLMTLVRQKQE